MRIAHDQIQVYLFVHDAEEREGGGINENMGRAQQAQKQDGQALAFPRLLFMVHARQVKATSREAQSNSAGLRGDQGRFNPKPEVRNPNQFNHRWTQMDTDKNGRKDIPCPFLSSLSVSLCLWGCPRP